MRFRGSGEKNGFELALGEANSAFRADILVDEMRLLTFSCDCLDRTVEGAGAALHAGVALDDTGFFPSMTKT